MNDVRPGGHLNAEQACAKDYINIDTGRIVEDTYFYIIRMERMCAPSDDLLVSFLWTFEAQCKP